MERQYVIPAMFKEVYAKIEVSSRVLLTSLKRTEEGEGGGERKKRRSCYSLIELEVSHFFSLFSL